MSSIFAIEGAGIDDKTSFLMQAAEAVRAPYESQNWDAFDEVLRDLEWAPAPGYVIVYTHSDRLADGAPAQFAIALDIFRSTVTSWLGTGIRMFVFLQSDGPHLAHDLPVHPC